MPRLRRWIPALLLACSVAVTPALVPIPTTAARAIVVTTTVDLAPPCAASALSLRCAIALANADGAGDTITFHIPTAAAGCAGVPAVCTIRPGKALPLLTASNTSINGYSQPGAAPNTNPFTAGDNAVLTIRLDGSSAGTGVNGLVVTGTNDLVTGLSITGFQTCFACPGQIPGAQEGGAGVEIRGAGDVVAGNFLGVLPDGRTAGPNQFAGVNIIDSEPFASAHAGASHVAPLSSASPAVPAFGVGRDMVGGATPAASNVLSGNSDCFEGDCEGSGVYVFSGSGSVIARNYIGTTVSGTTVLTNSATGVVIVAPRNLLVGNLISGSSGDGVLLGADGNLVTGNRIGTDDTGTRALGNGSHGLDVQAQGDAIRGNVISASGDTGLVLLGIGNVVQGNRIGTDVTGTRALGNGFYPPVIFLGQPINGTDGVAVCAGPNTLGGTAPGAGNVVSGNAGDGISLDSSGNMLQGNVVGTNAAGTSALPNGVDGIGSRAEIFQGVGFCQQAPGNGGNTNTLGGATLGAGNLVSGNAGDGIDLVASSGNAIAGNRIGVNAAATAALPNGGDGVFLGAFCNLGICTPSSNNTIGGTANGSSNVIGGNRGNGVQIDGTGGGLSNTVQGNRIGISGTVALSNGANGVLLVNDAVDDSVGGTNPGAGNVIAYNARSGVLIGASAADTGTHSAVQRNVIVANGGLGIDLAPQGTVNCTTPPPGPNDYTPCPVITSATTARVSGTTCAGCTVEVYVASGEADDLGHGEGRSFLGSTIADGSGAWSLTLPAGQIAAGQRMSATATTPVAFGTAPETSEFAANVMVG